MTVVASEVCASERDRERSAVAGMIARLEGTPVEVLSIEPLAGDRAPTELKRMGYGVPLLVRYRASGSAKCLVLRTQAPNWFGHDRRSDRACLSLLAADTYNQQPRHIAVHDVGVMRGGELLSLRHAGEFYLVTNYVEGSLYANDLRRIEQHGHCTALDLARVKALAAHLAEVHSMAPVAPAPEMYTRAIRDLVGSGEGIFGIVDSYPESFVRTDLLIRIETLAVQWRQRIGRKKTHRLRRTHGDFHPYNVLFREGTDFTALDASRGGVGEPADDLAAMSVNFLFGGVRHPEAWSEGFGPLWRAFFAEYFERAPDDGVLEHMAPFVAWRALVLASPAWYPDISDAVRTTLLAAAVHWLEGAAFDPETIEATLVARRSLT